MFLNCDICVENYAGTLSDNCLLPIFLVNICISITVKDSLSKSSCLTDHLSELFLWYLNKYI